MGPTLRLRQVCLVVPELEAPLKDLVHVFNLGKPHRDESVAQWGLENGVATVGSDFLELVAPIHPNTSAERYLKRRGGPGGYMVILHTEDARRERDRITSLGVRSVWESDDPKHVSTHFHPHDLGGPLLSIDSTEAGAAFWTDQAAWPPAGPHWIYYRKQGPTVRLDAVEIQAADPETMAARWSEVLDRPLIRNDEGLPIVDIGGGKLRFREATDDRGDGISAIDIHIHNDLMIFHRARELGYNYHRGKIVMSGCLFNMITI